jgi:hypothetical protein
MQSLKEQLPLTSFPQDIPLHANFLQGVVVKNLFFIIYGCFKTAVGLLHRHSQGYTGTLLHRCSFLILL